MNNQTLTTGFDPHFDVLTNPQFKSQCPIWVKKEEPIPCKKFKQKFHFFKIGKIFGMFTQRMLTVHESKLFYYENERNQSTKGHCDITGLYAGFFVTEQKYKYLIKLSNYSSISEIYLSDKQDFESLRSIISRYTIQVNFDQAFKLVEKIGEGSFAKVYMAKKKDTGVTYAVKIVRKYDSNSMPTIESVKQEKAVLSLCQSDYCCKYYEFYEDLHHYYFVLEHIEGKSLMAIVKQQIYLPVDRKIGILKGILEGLNHLHLKGIADRDVKPQNIIVDLETFKPTIIDFGLALFIRENTPLESFKRCGTMGYIAPQIMQSTEDKRIRYTTKVDMLSFGIVAHILLFGFNPLKGKNYDQTFQRNKEFNLQINTEKFNELFGQYCGAFFQGVLARSSAQRFSAFEALNHPFITTKHYESKKDLVITREHSIDFEEEQARTRIPSPCKKPVKKL